MNSEISKLVRDLQRRGWTIKHGGKHLKCKAPNGGRLVIAKTPNGGNRSMENTLADIRRVERGDPRYQPIPRGQK